MGTIKVQKVQLDGSGDNRIEMPANGHVRLVSNSTINFYPKNTATINIQANIFTVNGSLLIGTTNVQSGLANAVPNNVTTFISAGYTVNTYNASGNVAAYGTWTPDPANGNYQQVTSNGSLTVAVPTSNCAIDIMWVNGINPRTVTFSGYNVSASPGNYATTANNKYVLSIRKIGSFSTYAWYEMQ